MTTELIDCPTLTDLRYAYSVRNNIDWEIVGRMASSLRKLTSDYHYFKDARLLTNLTWLLLKNIKGDFEFSSLGSLETLIIAGSTYRSDLRFPSGPLDNLSHLEICNYAELNVKFLKNLTYLDIGIYQLPKNEELGELKKLKTLIVGPSGDSYLRRRDARFQIDISSLSSLITLKFLFCKSFDFIRGEDGIISHSLEDLSIIIADSNIEDSSLIAIPNLKYLSISRRYSYSRPEFTRACFLSLHKLFVLRIYKDDLEDAECIAALVNKGIVIKNCEKLEWFEISQRYGVLYEGVICDMRRYGN
ncbi:MAG: hypothetical protein Hyperionvirus16_36 [Hyperionvirus sp.]|uniref:Leucine-rich repeat domain-containing protein n=1 Tax=Hyperionvirus sp. TaxID=2487770 RepID=A0A3G5ACS7_9VIRU|nr:MAG: hypothetical protein Hyperionvirus16_36 [Hyperionvirus sp.]